ncbi:helix-turn-helix domain-containing protein [Stackebrandtia soli]|uniref:helix-turn-helix domain-containing protein n=1 Tax=Stackebrandtia soli TaxID=1892856 RepID=UPI0039EADCF5
MSRTLPDLSAFQRWVDRVLTHFRDTQGWSVSRVARESGTPRSMLYRWTNGEWDGGIPTRPVVERFCAGLGLPTQEPFSMFGWVADPQTMAPQPLPTVEDDDLLAIQEILKRRRITPEEAQEIRTVLRMMRRQYGSNEDDEAAS